MKFAKLVDSDRPKLEELLRSVGEFNADEVATALELIDDALSRPQESTYVIRVAHLDPDRIGGYTCFGPTPMTQSTWDLYWIAVAPSARRTGLGQRLHDDCVDRIRKAGGRRIRVETATREEYGGTHRFYESLRYQRISTFEDFYSPGDHLVTWCLPIEPEPVAPSEG